MKKLLGFIAGFFRIRQDKYFTVYSDDIIGIC